MLLWVGVITTLLWIIFGGIAHGNRMHGAEVVGDFAAEGNLHCRCILAQLGDQRIDGAEVGRHLAGHFAERVGAGAAEHAENLIHRIASLRGLL